jgi:hypothetical protein
MRTLGTIAGIELLALTGLALGCGSSALVTSKDAGADAQVDVKPDSGTTNNDTSGANQDSSTGGADTYAGGNQDTSGGRDTSIGGTDASKADTGTDVRAVDAGSGGRTVGSLGQCENGAGGTCTGAAAFSTCMTDNCDSDLRDCFGPSYASDTFAGPCADYMNCLWKCPCDANAKACQDTCTPLLAAGTCLSCLTGSWCMITSCGGPPACVLPTLPASDGGIRIGIDGGARADGGSAGGCAAAAACCAVIEARMGTSFGQLCTSAVTGSTDAQCDAALERYGALCS